LGLGEWRWHGGWTELRSEVVGVDHLEDLDVDGRMVLKWMLGRWGVRNRAGFGLFGVGSSARLLWAYKEIRG